MEFIELDFVEQPAMAERAAGFRDELARRRSIRDFSSRPVPAGVLEACLEAANSAPSGANLQPWHFAVIRGAETKRRIREAAEEEEREFYQGRAPDEWLDALQPFGTDWRKPFLETAPALVAVFLKGLSDLPDGRQSKTYYAKESAGIACGFLIGALHHAGLATLTHTPSPMGFLNRILDRPADEKPFLLLVVGFPVDGCRVPRLHKRGLEERCSLH